MTPRAYLFTAAVLAALAPAASASACAFHGLSGGGFDPFAFGGHMDPAEADIAVAAAPQPTRSEALARQRADLLARAAIKIENPLPQGAAVPAAQEHAATAD